MLNLLEPVIGIQTPRIKHVPTLGPGTAYLEAVELAKAYGLDPMPWQIEAVRVILAEELTGKWTVPVVNLSVPRQNGKGSVLEIVELYGLVVLRERIIHTAHEVKTSLDHFRRLKEGFFENENFPDLKKLVKKIVHTNGMEAIFLTNGASIRFISRSKSSGKGFTADRVVMDEAQELADIQHAALQGTLTTSKHPQQILTGTPPSPKDNGEVFPRMRKQALDGTNERMAWLEWSADKNADLLNHASWAQANPGLGITIDIQTLMDFHTTSSEDVFKREHLGMWDDGKLITVLDMDHWGTLANWDFNPREVVFAIDVAPDRSSASIAVAGYVKWIDPDIDSNPDLLVTDAVHVEVAHHGKGTGWIVDKMVRYTEAYNTVAVYVDEKANNGSLILDLKRAGVKVTTITGPDVSGSWGTFMDRVKNRSLVHADMPLIDIALINATTRGVLSGYAWDRKSADTDITPLVAITYAAYGLVQKRKPRTKVENEEGQQEEMMFL